MSKCQLAGVCALKGVGLTLFDMNCSNFNSASIKMHPLNCFNNMYIPRCCIKMFHMARKAAKNYAFFFTNIYKKDCEC